MLFLSSFQKLGILCTTLYIIYIKTLNIELDYEQNFLTVSFSLDFYKLIYFQNKDLVSITITDCFGFIKTN